MKYTVFKQLVGDPALVQKALTKGQPRLKFLLLP